MIKYFLKRDRNNNDKTNQDRPTCFHIPKNQPCNGSWWPSERRPKSVHGPVSPCYLLAQLQPAHLSCSPLAQAS